MKNALGLEIGGLRV